MDIFDEIDNLLQDGQKREIIEAQRRIIEIQQKFIDALGKQIVVVTDLAFPGATLEASEAAFLKRCQEEVPDVQMATARISAISDQLNAARDELYCLTGEEPT
jgi:outer membrane protein TolC